MTRNALVVGLGAIGSAIDDNCDDAVALTHASGYELHPETTLLAGVDPDGERLADFEATRDALGYDALEDALDAHDIDLLSVCTPPETHAAVVEAAVDAGVDAILCEKPLASDVETGERIVEQCRDFNVTLGVNYFRRCLPGCQIGRAMLRAGAIGGNRRAVIVYSKDLHANGSHMIDLARWWFGDTGSVAVYGGDDADASKVSDEQGAFVTFGDTLCHVVHVDTSAYNHTQLDVYGHEGRLQLLGQGRRLRWQATHESPTFEGFRALGNANEIETGLEWMCYFAVDDLVGAADGGALPACDGEDALETFDLCERLTNEDA